VQRVLASTKGEGMKHLPFTILVLSITFLCGASLGMCLYKRSVCQDLADAMERRAWDIVCAEPLGEERKPQDKEES
jgi:hypothetical protein